MTTLSAVPLRLQGLTINRCPKAKTVSLILAIAAASGLLPARIASIIVL